MLKAAQKHLELVDPVFAQLIAQYPPFGVPSNPHYYERLVNAIIGQQLSVKAAATIYERFVNQYGGVCPPADRLAVASVEDLRIAGLSRQKAGYIIDLAQHVTDGRLRLDEIAQLSNDEIIRKLTAVKGIGVGTAHMFLIFAAGRLDVLPVGDLGLRTGVRKLYGLNALPSAAELEHIVAQNHWHPYESVATWYIWCSLDSKPV